MKAKTLFTIIFVVGGISSIVYLSLSGFQALRTCHHEVTDTITYTDTIPFYLPVAKDSLVLRYETRRFSVRKAHAGTADTLRSIAPMPPSVCSLRYCSLYNDIPPTRDDSIDVTIPITQKMYEKDTYKVWVSGYEPRLDSIFVYQKTRIVNHYIKEKRKSWGIGIQLGYGASNEAFHPYVGVGIQYNIFSW